MKKIYTLLLASLIMASGSFAQSLIKRQAVPVVSPSVGIMSPVYMHSTKTLFSQEKDMLAVLNQNFDALTFPPSGWSVTGVTPSWYNSGDAAISQYEANGTPSGHFAYFDCFNMANNDAASLVTPVLHPVAGTNTLTYKVNLYLLNATYLATGAKMYIEFSTNGGTTWTTSTTNVLATLPSYNTASSGWQTKTVDLSTYNTQAVQVRFRAVSDYGGMGLGIDDVTGPNADVVLAVNDLVDNKTFCDFGGYGFYSLVPKDFISPVYYAMDVANVGSAVQPNIILTATVNGTPYVSNAYASLASGAHDTIVTNAAFTPPATANVQYDAYLNVAATGITDENIADNKDTVTFFTTDYLYSRANNITSVFNQTSFGTMGGNGMIFSSIYHFPVDGKIDSIGVFIYNDVTYTTAAGSIIKGVLFDDTFTQVDSTAAYTITGAGDLNTIKSLILVTPQPVTAGSVYLAGIKIVTTTGTNKVYVAADNRALFNLAATTLTFLPAGPSGASWYTGLSAQPLITLSVALASGIKNVETGNIGVYPNPSNGNITIVNAPNSNVEVYNLVGKLVYSASNVMSSVDLSSLTNGSYIVKISTKDGVYNGKINIVK
jgi:hypothetical protein